MSGDDLLYQIGVTLIKGVGAVNGKKLVAYCGSPEAVFKEGAAALSKIPGIGAAKDIINEGYYDLASQTGINYLRGVNNNFYSTTFTNSGFAGTSTETVTTVSYDENGKQVYEYKQVLVYKDKSGNMIGYQEYAEKKESNDDSGNGEQQSEEDWPTTEELEKDYADSFEEVVVEQYVNNKNYNPADVNKIMQDILYSGDLYTDKHYFVISPIAARVIAMKNGELVGNAFDIVDPYYDNGLPTVLNPGYRDPLIIFRNGVTYMFVIEYQITLPF